MKIGKSYKIPANDIDILPAYPGEQPVSQISRPKKNDVVKCIGVKKHPKFSFMYQVQTKDGVGWISGVTLLKHKYVETKWCEF